MLKGTLSPMMNGMCKINFLYLEINEADFGAPLMKSLT